ncbi:hypothetical protein P12x_000971 [Tundrisphaera lichenicola]|uniref:hypothetical protein n=1 Tax=Tundrisphaera lichenicola TaxID=2029860 RepID=UPI003EBEF28E
MTDQPQDDRSTSVPNRSSRLVRALYTHNPFYVLSADLVFIGLRSSFDPQAKVFDTWALILGLAGYTLLLATTACLMVRFGKVWDDMRSVLLLVVMMFLAISATIDDVLIIRPGVGMACSIGGLAFALIVSEGLLRGMRLGLPALYRLPYYLILTLFFVYPLALRPMLARPDSATSHWALFGFSTVAALAFLTLLPAIRRGSSYIEGNGSPWRWPLYPWSLFFFLGLGVCARSYYLCISLHNVEGFRSIFGPYFLIPFGFAIALLLLEGGLTSGRKGVVRFALAIPAGLVVLSMVGHRPDMVYQRFLAMFREGLGVAPPAASLILALGFYGLASLRKVPMARGLAMASLVGLSVVGPGTMGPDSLIRPQAWALAPVGLIQAWLAYRRHESWRVLIAATCVVGSISGSAGDSWSVSLVFHLSLAAVLVIGAVCEEELGSVFRFLGALMLAFATIFVVTGEPYLSEGLSPLAVRLYPLGIALVALAYGVSFGGIPYYVVAGTILVGALGEFGLKWYLLARARVAGLDRIMLGLASFLVAAAISLRKAGLVPKWPVRKKPSDFEPSPLAD